VGIPQPNLSAAGTEVAPVAAARKIELISTAMNKNAARKASDLFILSSSLILSFSHNLEHLLRA
jgi:hypothetical protein